MNSIPNYFECLQILQNASTPSNVIDHTIFTAQTAISISKILKKKFLNLNCELILAGALLHDIGRSKSHKLNHAVIGGQILKELNLPDSLIWIVERHIFAGITKEETVELELPFRDFLPQTLEEKIVAYSDNVSKRDSILSLNEVVKRYTRYLPQNHPIIIRVRVLHNEIENLMNRIETNTL